MVLKTNLYQQNLGRVKIRKVSRSDTSYPPKTRRSKLGIAGLFFGTIFLSLAFWLKSSISDWWQKFNQPSEYKIISPLAGDLVLDREQERGDEEGPGQKLETLTDIKDVCLKYVGGLRGTYGVYFYLPEDKLSFGIEENKVFTAASVNKIPILVSFYENVEKANLKLSDEYVLERLDITSGTGSMQYDSIGTRYTYEELVQLMGKESDNTAAHVVLKVIGLDKVEKRLGVLGMESTSIEDNTTTPKEMGDYFVKFYQGKLLSEEHTQAVMDVLTDTDFEKRIPKGVPEDVRVVHKIGNEVQVYNDCGVVFADDPYVLCVLTEEVAEAEAMEVIPKISRAVWKFVEDRRAR